MVVIARKDYYRNEGIVMQPLVAVLMGSKSDWETMSHCADTLEKLGVACDVRVLSAHRTPDQLFDYIKEEIGRASCRERV